MAGLSLSNEPFLWPAAASSGGRDNGRAVLLLHGLGGGIYELGLVAKRLHESGFTVRGINYPGHDRPAKVMPPSRWEDWFQSALDAYRALAQDHPLVSLVGFSTGCQVALLLASERSVDRMALLSPFVRVRHRWFYGARPEAYLRAFGRFSDQVPRRPLAIEDPEARAAVSRVSRPRTFNLTAVRSALELIDRVEPRLPSITSPVILLQSKGDLVVDPAGADHIYERLGSKEKELVWLHRSDHAIALDTERDLVLESVARFLAPPPRSAGSNLSG